MNHVLYQANLTCIITTSSYISEASGKHLYGWERFPSLQATHIVVNRISFSNWLYDRYLGKWFLVYSESLSLASWVLTTGVSGMQDSSLWRRLHSVMQDLEVTSRYGPQKHTNNLILNRQVGQIKLLGK